MMNTFGFFSINDSSFNQWPASDRDYKNRMTDSNHCFASVRDDIYTFFKVHNLIFNALGYSRFGKFSGYGRIFSGFSMVAFTLLQKTKTYKNKQITIKVGPPKGHFYKEAILTGISQISKGILEVYFSERMKLRVALECLGTIYNLGRLAVISYQTLGITEGNCGPENAYSDWCILPHPNPPFSPSFFEVLQLV